VDVAVKAVRSQVVKAAIIALLLGGLASIALSYSMTRQIREITTGTAHFAREDLGYRIPVVTGDELGEIAQNFNLMAEQIASNTERRKSLLAGVSHEVRTPLTNIRGYIEALRDGVIPEKDRPATLDLIHSEALFMGRMVNDLIDLSRMETDSYRLTFSKIELSAIIETVAVKLKSLAVAQGNQLTYSGNDTIFLEADETRIEQLLTNLVHNAIQYTENGDIRISSSLKGDRVEIVVEDNGIGIAEDKLPYIFDSFYKVNPSRSKEHAESGLGLAVVQRIVKLHHGEIDVASTPGRGTRVAVKLPVRQDMKPA
jgi:signal transduction histidine kinase